MTQNPGSRGGGNRKTVGTSEKPPWAAWQTRSRHARAIRFMETYCRTPTGFRPRAPIELTPSQKLWFEEILSGDVTTAVKSCPRGEGKSTEMAALACWATFDECESGDPQVPIIGTRVSQAKRSIYDVFVKMIELEPELQLRALTFTGIGVERTDVPWTGGSCFPMANNVDGLQGLNPSVAIMDEIGFQPDDAWNSLVLALGKRPWSLVVGTGTPGFNYDNALWANRKRYLDSKDGLRGFSYTEIAADPDCDIYDDAQLRLANPSIDAGYKSLDSLRSKRETMPESRFRIFHLGQWVEGVESWLGENGLQVWQALLDPHEFIPNRRTWVGIDIGQKSDSTAVVWGQLRDDGRLHVKCRIWMPKRGQVVDLNEIMNFLRELNGLYKVDAFAYDPRLFDFSARMLLKEGLKMIEMNQAPERTMPAFAELLRWIKTGRLTHDDDEEFQSQVLNGRPKNTERGFTLYKIKYTWKIDAAYALMMMFDRAQHATAAKAPLEIAR